MHAKGMADLVSAVDAACVSAHDVIKDAAADQGRDYNVFSVPVRISFPPLFRRVTLTSKSCR